MPKRGFIWPAQKESAKKMSSLTIQDQTQKRQKRNWVVMEFIVKKFMELPAPIRSLVSYSLQSEDGLVGYAAVDALYYYTSTDHASEVEEFYSKELEEFRPTRRQENAARKKIYEYFRKNLRLKGPTAQWSQEVFIDPPAIKPRLGKHRDKSTKRS